MSAQKKYQVTEADFKLLKQSLEYIKKSVDELLEGSKDYPVYKKTVDTLVKDVAKN